MFRAGHLHRRVLTASLAVLAGCGPAMAARTPDRPRADRVPARPLTPAASCIVVDDPARSRITVALDSAAAAAFTEAHVSDPPFVDCAGMLREPGIGPGTGPFEALRLRGPVLAARPPVDASTPDTIDVRVITRDLRIAIDDGADVLVTNDAATLAYARARPEYRLAPLPWTRTYVLATRYAGTSPGTDELAALARDAVHADTRPAESSACAPDSIALPAAPAPSSIRDIVAYPRGDEAAREIAERIVALAWPSDRAPAWLRERMGPISEPLRAVAIDARDVADVLERNPARAVVVALPRPPFESCFETMSGTSAIESLRDDWMLLPLLDTRDHLVYRRGIGRVMVDGTGMIRFGRR